MRVVVLTAGGWYGVLVLEALRSHATVPAAVVVQTNASLRACFHHRSVRGRLSEMHLVPLRAIWRRLRPRFRRDLRIGAPIIPTGALNSATMRRDLARARPDLLVLAGTGIVSAELLRIPRLGTLNVHPGLLPWVRGNGVVAHSVLRGVAIGATCYLVDPGIDTGAVVRRCLLDVGQVEPSLAALERESVRAGAAVLAEVVRDTVAALALPPAIAQRERFPLCRWPPAEQRDEVDALIAAGRARELYRAWSAVADSANGDLPASATAPPCLSIHPVRTPEPRA